MDRREYPQYKFGDPDRFKPMQGRMQAITAKLGIDYQPERQQRMPNTRLSHRLLAASAGLGRQTELKESIWPPISPRAAISALRLWRGRGGSVVS